MNSAKASHSSTLLTIACFIILIAGLQAAQAIIIPLLMALLITFICLPGVQAMLKCNIHPGIAITSVSIAFLTLIGLLMLFAGNSISQFLSNVPQLQTELEQQLPHWLEQLASLGIHLSSDWVLSYMDPGAAMQMVGKIFAGLGNVMTNILLIMLLVVFLLSESIDLPRKSHLLGRHAPSPESVRLFMDKVNHYLLVKLGISTVTGILVATWLWLLGINYPLLWGILALLLNFIPNVGSIIAAIPAVILAAVQVDISTALWVASGYIIINLTMGNVIEPRYMARGVGLSTLVVFVSLIFWGWVLGPTGMLLSIPLTMIAKLALESREDTRWIAVLLSPAPDTSSHSSS